MKNVAKFIEEYEEYDFPKNCLMPLSTSYHPELDVSPELNPRLSSYYMSVIGILRWIVELGRVDICLEALMMASHMAMPHEGHLRQVLHIFLYLEKFHNTELVFDPSDRAIDPTLYQHKDWTSSEFAHLDGKEDIPPNCPEPRGYGFQISAEVDVDNARDSVT